MSNALNDKVNLYEYVTSGELATGYYDLTLTANDEVISAEVYVFDEDITYSSSPTLGDTNADTTMLILIYKGDLTINSGVTIIPQVRKKGMLMYVAGTLTNNGTISMTARGAKAAGQDVYLYGNEYVPAVGGAQTDRAVRTTQGYTAGITGNAGTGRQTGSGGGGGAHTGGSSRTAYGGYGAAGTSYSGGAGGGCGCRGYGGTTVYGGDGGSNGGAGGNGVSPDSISWETVGGGAGNPGGTKGYNGAAGSSGTGGLLIIFATDLVNTGSIVSNGSAGGYGAGGGSGGGSINLFYINSYSSTGTITAAGGAGGSGNSSGGTGGVGTITVTEIILVSDPVSYEGFLIDDISSAIQQSRSYTGTEILGIDSAARPSRPYTGISTDDIFSALKSSNGSAILLDDVQQANRHSKKIGMLIDSIESAMRRFTSFNGIQVDDVVPGFRMYSTFAGIEIDPITMTSNANDKFTLTITPTHQYKNQLVNIAFSHRRGSSILGRYALLINGEQVVSSGTVDIDLKNISFDVNPGKFIVGANTCRILIIYPDATQEYLDFAIVREEPQRTAVERLFRDYDGGYEGNRLALPYIVIPAIYPAFLTPATISDNTIIKTTNYTSISLSKYTEIQKVTLEGQGIRVLVSFDGGITWKSFIDSWQTVDISNIASSGMTKDAIEAVTIAQWAEIFTATSLDFAIYMDDTLNDIVNSLATSSINTITSFSTTGGLTYTKPGGKRITSAYGYCGSTSGTDTSITRRTIYSTKYPSGYTTLFYLATINTYVADDNELITSIVFTQGASGSNTATVQNTIYGVDTSAYLKSINVQITPKLKTGYAFIM